MTEPSTPPRTGVNPLLRFLPLVAILFLIWPLSGQNLDVFGLELSAAIVGAVLATLGVAYGTVAARGR